MIAWMQKNNKYLVVTIWIATIAFIGAGFVGWGSYKYGSKSGAIAKVGKVKISQEKYQFSYQNLYQEVSKSFGGQFDDAKAKSLGLSNQVFQTLVIQAYWLNLAKDYGIVVSDNELANSIVSIPAFQEKGVFSKRDYNAFLDSRGLNSKSFEAIFRDELIVQKLMKLIDKQSVPYERNVISSALGVEDKIKYQVLSSNDINVSVDEVAVKKYWKEHKDSYKTPKMFKLSLLWTETSDLNVSKDTLKEFYRKNSFNYTSNNGKTLSFKEAYKSLLKDYRLKKAKKRALLDYIALKKGKKSPTKTEIFIKGDKKLSSELWKEIITHNVGELIKPKAVGDRYVTVRIEKEIPSHIMSFEEAKKEVVRAWIAKQKSKLLLEKAKDILKDSTKLIYESKYLKLSYSGKITPLNSIESMEFLKKLFLSNHKKGIIPIRRGRVVAYLIVSQKIAKADSNLSTGIKAVADQIKRRSLEQNLLKELSKRYPVEKFVKGL